MNRRRRFEFAAACFLAGCGSDPKPIAIPPLPELESKIGQRLKLSDVHLVEASKGRFTGNGKGVDGKTYEVKVTIAEKAAAWEKMYKTPKGEIETTGGGFDWTQ